MEDGYPLGLISPDRRFESGSRNQILMYQWMLIPSMPVAVSLKRWFESNHQYGSVGSRVQLKNGSGKHLKMSPQDVKPFIQFWAIKTDVFRGKVYVNKMNPWR